MTYLGRFHRHLMVAAGATLATVLASAQAGNRELFEGVGVRAGLTVCEIGAGAGETTIAAAKVVGAQGRVIATELGDDQVKALRDKTGASGLTNITVVAGETTRTNIADATCDAVFMKDVYHHFSEPAAMNASIFRSMKPGAKLGIVEFTPPPGADAPTPAERGKDGMHGIRPPALVRELTDAGFLVVPRDYGEARSYTVIAERRAPDSQ